MENDRQLINRFDDLAHRAETRRTATYTEFLNCAQQDILLGMQLPCPVTLSGGFGSAERRVACFGDEPDFPIACIKVEPLNPRFADALTHRDFLGSLMGLGIRREVIGDIIISDNCGYVFCLTSIAGFIVNEFTKARHTQVKCSVVSSPPPQSTALPDSSELVVAGERLDAIIASVYGISRSESKALFDVGKVFINSRLCSNASHKLCGGETVSVRGFGRFIYEGIRTETRKGKLRVTVRIF